METGSGLLAPLGVSELEERVYRALLATPDSTRSELADAAGARRARVTVALRRLESLGTGQPDCRSPAAARPPSGPTSPSRHSSRPRSTASCRCARP